MVMLKRILGQNTGQLQRSHSMFNSSQCWLIDMKSGIEHTVASLGTKGQLMPDLELK